MKILSLDVETTTSTKGDPFDSTNSCVSVAWHDGISSHCVNVYERCGRALAEVQEAIDSCETLVGFNIKFDLHWLRNLGLRFNHRRVFDCQVAQYVISRQRTKYPSLAGCLELYGLEGKIDIVKEEYWDKGIDTPDIPWDILSAYNITDVEQTYQLYLAQQALLNPIQRRLVQLCCDDLVTLEEMEYNGIPVDLDGCQKELERLYGEIDAIIKKLASRYPHVPINFNSPDHVSAYLYGGDVEEVRRELAGFYKTGNKIGQPRYKVVRQTHTLMGMFKPIEGSELEKEGLFSTSEPILRQIKDKSGTIKLLLEFAALTKLKEFFESFIKINAERNWRQGEIHGSFNQVSTWTGRLSSTKPNLQNMPPELQEFVRSEYG